MNSKIIAETKTKIGAISLMKNGIIRVYGNSDIHIELEDMYENDKAFIELTNGRPAPFLVVFGFNTSIEPEAIEYFTNPNRPQLKIAEALVTPQLHHKIIANQLLTFGKPIYPVKHFTDEIRALKWLIKFCA